jgi:hypothetical protein
LAEISPPVMMQLFVAFGPLFALVFALLFKAVFSLRDDCAQHIPSGDPIIIYLRKRECVLHAGSCFPRHWNRFANFRVNDKGPTGSVEPRQNNPPSILHQKQSRDVFGVNFLTLISWAAAT